MNQLWQNIINVIGLGGYFNSLVIAKILFQVLIIGYALTWIWSRIRGTQAGRLIKGVIVLSLVWLSSYLLGLTIITAILQQMVPIILIAVVIVFQPELRRGLGYLGRTAFKVDFSLTDTQNEQYKSVINEIVLAVRELSTSKTGALIVVEPLEGERDYVNPGTTLNAIVSAPLLLSIFQTNSPLHDGAVVIRKNKIVAAGVILPITENTGLSQSYGTRHRAALGLSEIYDGLCIVASEETGAISAASRGMLVRYNCADELTDALMYMYNQAPDQKTEGPLQSLFQLFQKGKSWAANVSKHGLKDHPRRRATDFPRDERLDK